MRTVYTNLWKVIGIPLSDLITAILGLCLLAALALAAHPKSVLFSDANTDPASTTPIHQVTQRP